MPRRVKEKKVDTASLNLMFTEAIRHQLNRPNLYAYRPHAKQLKFHKANTHTRLYIGGNRSGKTTGGVVEDIYWLIGRHPYKRLPFQDQPVRGRAVAVDFNYGVAQILLPEFARWLPPSFLINGSWEDSYNKEFRMLTLANKSTLEFKSYDQDLEKFAGTSRHFCISEDTRILTKRGWIDYAQMTVDDEILTVNPETGLNEWQPINYIYRGQADRITKIASRNNFEALVTEDHRWLVENKKTKKRYLAKTSELNTSEQFVLLGSAVEQDTEVYADEFVALVGWVATDGSFVNTNQISICQSWKANPDKVDQIEELLDALDAPYNVYDNNGACTFYIKRGPLVENIKNVLTKTKALKPEFLANLSTRQLRILLDAILDGDGCRLESGKIMIADDLKYPERMDSYAMLLSMLGRRAMYTVAGASNSYQMLSKSDRGRYDYSKASVSNFDIREVKYNGIVWCPNTDNQTFYAMRNGKVFLTGNTHYDEEPPQHIYNECQARLVDTNGYSWLTMTPVEGMSWVYDSLYLPGTEGKDPDISVVEVDMLDNPHIGAEAAERYLKGLDEEERAAREKGHFMEMGGKVFKNFSKQAHVIPPINPKSVANWRRFVSIDHGYNNPTAILWHAVSPNNEVVTFDEHYASEMTVAEHAKVYHERCKGHGFYPDMVVGDPAMQQRNGVTGTSIVQEYAEAGIYVGQANNDVASGINRMVQYLRVDPTIGRPRWRITENCPSLIYEMVRLRWKTYSNRKAQFENNRREEIHKKDDHAADSARYFFSFMPDLAPDLETEQKIMDYSAVLGATRPAPVGNKVDSYFQKPTDNWEISPVGTDFQGFEY